MDALTFKDFRKYVSKVDLLSICKKEDLSYENFRFMKDVPATYDKYYIYGIGMIESEFPAKWICNSKELERIKQDVEFVISPCLEIMVSKTPKGVI